MGFKFGYIVTIDRISDVSTCDDLGSIFKVTVGLKAHLLLKRSHFTPCGCNISKGFSWMAFKFGFMLTMDRILHAPNLDAHGSIFNVTA